jgi:hypothetical protein
MLLKMNIILYFVVVCLETTELNINYNVFWASKNKLNIYVTTMNKKNMLC